jgi:hypothetical protein
MGAFRVARGRRARAHRLTAGRRSGLAVAALVALLLAGCEPLSQAELRREIDGIASVAAEGAVLSDQVATQQTKRTFARVQARELSEAAGHSAERLTDAHPESGLGEPTARAVTLAQEVSDAIGEIEVAPDDADGAAAAARRLRHLAGEAQQLSDGL